MRFFWNEEDSSEFVKIRQFPTFGFLLEDKRENIFFDTFWKFEI